MTREEIIDGLEIYTVGRLKKDIVYITVEELQKFIDAIEALEQEPCEDCVSRKDLIDKLEILDKRYGSDFYWEVRKIVDSLQPVTPTQKWS